MKKKILSLCFLLGILGNLYLDCAEPVIFHTDQLESPGKIFYVTGGVERQFFQASSGSIYNCAFGNDGLLYFSNQNDKKLFCVFNEEPTVIYEHTAYIRDIGVHPDGRVYFSETSGSSADGKIYRLIDGAVQLFYTVRLSEVNGYWNGNFAFDTSGTLYLSSGDTIGASLYKVINNIPTPIYSNPGGRIGGFDFDNSGMIYYSDWVHTVYKLNLLTGIRTVYRSDASRLFSDVWVMKHYIALGPEAGRVNHIVSHPTLPNILYAGTSSGGVFRSYNSGETWFLMSKGITDPQIGGLLIYPSNPRIVIAVTPSGVFRSYSNGLSWTEVLSTPRLLPPPNMPLFVNSMQKSPVRFDSATGNIYAAPFGTGLYKSTDAGVGWTQIFGSDIPEPKNRSVMDIDIAPENGGTLFITTLGGLKKYNAGVWSSYGNEIVSTTPGKVLSPILVRVAPSSPQRIYVTAADLLGWPPEANLWKRDTTGGLFSKTTIGTPPWVSWSILESIAISPIDANRVWVGAVDAFYSDDSGSSWDLLNSLNLCSDSMICGVDYRELLFDSSLNCIYAAHDQGIFRRDYSLRLIRAVEKGLNNTQFYDLDIGPAGTVYGGTQDTGTFRKKVGLHWETIYSAGSNDVFDVLADPTNDSKLFIRVNSPQLIISTNYGSTTSLSSGLVSSFWGNHQLVYIPSSNTLYAGTRYSGVYKSTDGGVSFNPANSGIENLEIRCLDNQPGNAQVVYAGTLKNGLYKTVTGGARWQKLVNFPDVAVICLKVLADGGTVYAGTSNGVFVTTDGGTTWISRSDGLPARKVVSEIVIDPTNPSCFYIGLGYYSYEGLYGGGVYWSSNNGNTWSPLSSSQSQNMSVTSIRFDSNDSSRLWVATYGSGVITLFKEN